MSLTKVSGSILKDPLNLGEVSIGGTLTYQDVTNVDSVGVVTARTDINLGDSIIHIGDTNTKIRFPAADTITAETSGTERVRIKSDGKVGIGTVNPSQLLQLGGDGGDACISLMRTNAASNNNAWGHVFFENSSDAVLASISARRESAADDAYLTFSTQSSGNSITEKVRITSSGRVGINESAPLGKLHVKSGDSSATVGASADELVLESSANTGMSILSGTSNEGAINFGDSGANNVGKIVYMHNGDYMYFKTNAVERLRIKSDGNVGIGTINPQAQLEVYKVGTGVTATSVVRGESAVFAIMGDATNTGASETDARLVFSSDGDVSPSKILTSPLATHGFEIALINEEPGAGLRFHDGTANAERLRINSTGQLLVGNSASGFATKMIVGSGSGENGITIYGGTSNNTYLHFADGNSGADRYRGYVNYSHSNNSMQFGTNDVERLRVHSSGKLQTYNTFTSSASSFLQLGDAQGIFEVQMSDGTGGADVINHVKQRFVSKNTYGLNITSRSTLQGSYTKAGEASIKFYYPSAGGGNQAGGQLEFWTNQNGYAGTNESKRMQIDNGGNIGAPTGNNIYNASDERLKENMVELTNGLDKIKKLKPISFNWKDGWDECMSGKKEYGFGAQTTQVVDEMLVEPFGTEDALLNGEVIKDPLRVNEKYITPLLVKAIQEQQEQIETLKAEVAALKSS